MRKNKIISNQVTTGQMLGLMLLAYLFSFAIRMIWVYQFQDNPNFMWNGQLMINTNDGYFFAAGAQEALSGLHADNPRVFGVWDYGVIFFTTLLSRITPFSLETVILYMPAVISSLVVIPMILIARLYKQTLWGFFAALLGSIAWSYYNRTMTGYYDTDMFSAMAPMFILFFLMKSTVDLKLRTALYAGIAIIIYPFLYDQGQAIIYAIGIIYAAYMLWFHKNDIIAYSSSILIFIALTPLGILEIEKPLNYVAHFIILFVVYVFLKRSRLDIKRLQVLAFISFVLFLFLGNVVGLILGKILSYTIKGTEEGSLHFYAVNQTVREAGSIPFKTFANRTSGSTIGVLISLVGYVVLVVRRPAFILALPLIGIGIFALWGGLRFTVYAVPVAAMSAIYLFFVASEFIDDLKIKYAFIVLATAAMIYPNITHIVAYKVPTVLNESEVQDLAKLDKLASGKDYTLTWWDYGYPVWYYSDTSTLIDGGKHNNDNFIISKIMQTSSPRLAANLARLSVETYVDSNYSVVANTIFDEDKNNPNIMLSEMQSNKYKLPNKTRDIYLYMPYRMMNIFPTVMVFGNLDLMTGKKERNIMFAPLQAIKNEQGKILFQNGVIFDTKKGELAMRGGKQKVKYFIATSNTSSGLISIKSQKYNSNGQYVVVYMKSYGKFLVMDSETFNSMYVQMFVLGKYDRNLFELVVSSPYSRIYKLKI